MSRGEKDQLFYKVPISDTNTAAKNQVLRVPNANGVLSIPPDTQAIRVFTARQLILHKGANNRIL